MRRLYSAALSAAIVSTIAGAQAKAGVFDPPDLGFFSIAVDPRFYPTPVNRMIARQAALLRSGNQNTYDFINKLDNLVGKVATGISPGSRLTSPFPNKSAYQVGLLIRNNFRSGIPFGAR